MLERKRHRTVERAVAQLEELLDSHSRPNPEVYVAMYGSKYGKHLSDDVVEYGTLHS